MCSVIFQMDSLGDRSKFKGGAVFYAQITLLYIVVITSIVNLSLGNESSTLWTSLLCSCLGYILPQPKLKVSKYNGAFNLPVSRVGSVISERF